MTPSLTTRMKALYVRESFRPGLIAMFIDPFYIARRGLFESIADLSHHVGGRVLDVGCGQKPYEALFQTTEYVGLELDTVENRQKKKADFFYEGRVFPFENASFDTVILNQVLEHVFNPDEFLGEINRVLKQGGGLLLTTPFMWDEHEQPHDFARYSSFGLRHLLETHGFRVVEHRKSVADVRVIFQMINCYIHKSVNLWNPYLKLIAWVLLTSPFNFLGTVIYRMLPPNKDLFLDNVVFARTKTGDSG